MAEMITKNIQIRSDYSLFLFSMKERFNKAEGKIIVNVSIVIGSFLVEIVLPYAAFLGKKSEAVYVFRKPECSIKKHDLSAI